jgi:nucleoid-associated protein YgaU
MKLTKSKLKQLIKEELKKVLNENKPVDREDPLVKEAIAERRYYVKRPSKYDDRTVPDRGAPEPDKSAYASVYTIREGDTLSEIAKKKLGDSKKWEHLLDHNELLAAVPPLHGENKDGSPKIQVGWKLHIPNATQ